MSLFRCEQCGCVENTALCLYWTRGDGPALCSACDPKIGAWHGVFEREDADAASYRPRPGDSEFVERSTPGQ